jgi:glycosyltransferase involved in cell wall biosynthesis
MLNRYNPANAEWQRRNLAARTQEAIFNADAVIVENERLGAMVGKINRDWHIVQNALDFSAKQWNLSREPSETFRVGFIGSRSHRYDLLMIADALRAFGEAGGVEINLCGYDPADREWTAVAEGIAPGTHPDWLKLRPGVHPSEYGGYYAGMDVVIAPLISNNFNAMKSDIKVKEAGAYSLPLIASDFGPYRNHESAGVYTAKNNREWLALLNRAKAGELDGRPNAEYLQDAGCLQHVNLRRVEIYSAVIQSVTK